MLIDIHAHLTDKKYSESIEEIVFACKNNGVSLIVDSGYSIETSLAARANANSFDSVYFVCGIHPEKQAEYTDDTKRLLIELASDEKCVGIGEIGLDYHYDGYDKNGQKNAFVRQIELANELGLPFVVHSRDASNDVFETLSANKSLIKHGFLMHCYSESKEMAKRYLDLGAYFSFGGVITFKNAKKEDIIRSIPLERIITETDSPYLTPVPHRGEINSPKNVVFVYEKLSEILGVSGERLQKIVEDNAKSLFKKLKV